MTSSTQVASQVSRSKRKAQVGSSGRTVWPYYSKRNTGKPFVVKWVEPDCTLVNQESYATEPERDKRIQALLHDLVDPADLRNGPAADPTTFGAKVRKGASVRHMAVALARLANDGKLADARELM